MGVIIMMDTVFTGAGNSSPVKEALRWCKGIKQQNKC